MKRQLRYLVRTRDGVQLVSRKPAGVTFTENGKRWIFLEQRYAVGGDVAAFLDCDNWSGPVGVYDISIPRHVSALFRQARLHEREALSHILIDAWGKLIGADAVAKATVTRTIQAKWDKRSPAPKLNNSLRLYLNATDMTRLICRSRR